MDPDTPEINAHILFEADHVIMHRLVRKDKSLFSEGIDSFVVGVCKLAKIDNPNQRVVYFFNINSFYYTLNKDVTFARIEYEDTVSYLFPHFDNGLSSVTLLKSSPAIYSFEEIIRNASNLLDFKEALSID